jgi:hypothetical protein
VQLIHGLSNNLSVDIHIGPSGAPDPGVVPPEQLQKIIEADTLALKAAGGDPAAPPVF